MSFYDIYLENKDFNIEKFFSSITPADIQKSIVENKLNSQQFLSLLSLQAEDNLEQMAQRAQEITRRNFGNTIQLYTPMYLSNYCNNSCLYCGFNLNNNIERKKLELDEVENEAKFISSTGLKHILILTGESAQKTPVSYIRDCVKILKKYFSSISIEIYPLKEDEYVELIEQGVDGLVVYQEVYDAELYAQMHIYGPKNDYRFRLDTPERGARSKMRSVSLGALLGLADWRKEAFFLGLHAKYLQDKFPDVEIGIAVPRLRPQVSGFKPVCQVSDRNIVQMILALRIFLPRLGITLSTRESQDFRDKLISLGITRMSAGSTTKVGGHTIGAKETEQSCQFQIQDQRSVDEVKEMIKAKGYQPVFKDWLQF